MPKARDLHRQEIANRESSDEHTAASGHSKALRGQTLNQHADPSEKQQERLASDDPQEHDSDVWHVSDDWPEFVPITPDEVEVIEAFLRDALDELLK